MNWKQTISSLLGVSIICLSGLANAQDMNPQLNEATRFFSEIATSQNPLIAALARESLSRLQQEQPVKPVEVALLPQSNNSLAVPAMLNGNVMATFLVDTGASYTVITPRMARKLGITITRTTPRISIITANGYIKAPVVNINRMTIGSLEVQNVQAIVQNLGDDLLLAGLLGMNFFEGMDLTVKQDRLVIGTRNEG